MKPFRIVFASLSFSSIALAHTDVPASLFVEGYVGQVSYAQGEEVDLHVSTPAAKYSVEIARIGAEKKVMWSKDGLPGKESPVPEDASANGCRWPESVLVPTTKDWPSGYYEATLKCADTGGKWTHRGARTAQSSVWFILRPAEPGAKSKILLQLCTNTYNAYNNWGGFSVYAYNSLSNNKGHKVSFDRPGPSQFARWEHPFVEWAERNGYVLDFAANNDLESHPEMLASYKLVLSVGHYLLKRPENELTGVGFLWGGYQISHGQFMDGPGAYTVYRPDHWILEGTGLKKGDMFGGKDTIVGYECDGCEIETKDGLPVPTHRDGTPEGFTILCMCPAKWHPDDSEWYEKWDKGRIGQSVMGTYAKSGGGTVFTTGSTDWAHGLRGKDAAVERITKNVLGRLGS